MALDRDTLRDYLSTKLKVKLDGLEDDTALFSSGRVDSFAMIDLIRFLEDSGGFKINPLDVSLDNLDSVEKILSFAARSTA